MADPRARTVTSHERLAGRNYVLSLECGHVQRRRLSFAPDRVVCVECPVPADWAAQCLHRTTKLPAVARPVGERMTVAREQMVGRRRTPRVFYLTPDDYAEFLFSDPPEITATFSGFPVTVKGWNGLAVRASQGKGRSTLYCCLGTSTGVPLR